MEIDKSQGGEVAGNQHYGIPGTLLCQDFSATLGSAKNRWRSTQIPATDQSGIFSWQTGNMKG